MIKNLTIFLLILCVLPGCAQNKKNRQFERKLFAFRYSLYEDLGKMSDEKLLNVFRNDFKDIPDSTVKKVKRFYEHHQQDIQAYKLYRLKQLSYNEPIKEKTLLKGTIKKRKEMNEIMQKFLGSKALYNLLTIDPLYQVNLYASAILSRKLSATQLAAQSTRDNIAQALIYARKLNKNEWELWLDKYHYVFRFVYHLDSSKMKLKAFYTRK